VEVPEPPGAEAEAVLVTYADTVLLALRVTNGDCDGSLDTEEVAEGDDVEDTDRVGESEILALIDNVDDIVDENDGTTVNDAKLVTV
jgi:hypothetical protein